MTRIKNGAVATKGMKAANRGHQTGNKIVIREVPKGKKYKGIEVGDMYTIVTPPEGYLNSGMAVYIRPKRNKGKSVALSFSYWLPVPEGVEIHKEVFAKKYPPIEKGVYVVPKVPEKTPVRRRKQEVEVKATRRKSPVNQPVAKRRRK